VSDLFHLPQVRHPAIARSQAAGKQKKGSGLVAKKGPARRPPTASRRRRSGALEEVLRDIARAGLPRQAAVAEFFRRTYVPFASLRTLLPHLNPVLPVPGPSTNGTKTTGTLGSEVTGLLRIPERTFFKGRLSFFNIKKLSKIHLISSHP
jgi:hypothetical protein